MRLNQSRRVAVKGAIPPRKCGRPTRKGTPCIRDVVVGATVCPTHGGMAPQVRAAAEKRVTLAEAMLSGIKRHPHEVLEDALHAADLLMRDVVLEMSDAGAVTPALMDSFVQAFERAHRLAKVNMDAGIDMRRMRLAEAQAGQMHAIFTRVLSALHLTPEQKAMVPQLLRREIEGEIAA